MDEFSMERVLRDAPRPEFGDGHEDRFTRRCGRRFGLWRAVVAALLAFGAGAWLIVVATRNDDRARERVQAVTVYWNRASPTEVLDISRWNCDGCGREGSAQ